MFEKFKQQVKESFSRSAMTYDAQPDLHDLIIEKVLAKIQGDHKFILDIGCGTGKLVGRLVEKYPQAKIIGLDIAPGMIEKARERVKSHNVRFIEGDGEALPFQAGQFDLVVSTASMQWMSAGKTIAEAARVLKPKGKFYFATFGPKTLAELKEAGLAINYFLAQDKLEQLLTKFFKSRKIEVEPIKRFFADVFDLLKYLKQIGANVYDSPREHGLVTAKKLKSVLPGEIAVTFEAIYGVYVK